MTVKPRHAAKELTMASSSEVPEAMWGGLARDIMMWLDMHPKTPRALFKHLESIGRDIPQWLRDEPEMQALDHVPSKGTRCVLIYRAMQEAAKDQPIALDPVQDVRNRIAVEVEGDSDSPLRVAEANAIYDGLRDDNYPEIIAAKNMSQPIALDEVERVARALHAVEVSWNDIAWEYIPAHCQELFRRNARAAIAALVRSPIGDDVREAVARLNVAIERGEQFLPPANGCSKLTTCQIDDLRILITAIGSQSIEPHGPQCSDYHRACRQCLAGFDEWKASQSIEGERG